MHRLSAKYLYLIGGCALSSEREPIGQIERIRVEELEKRKVRVIAENCGQLAVPRRAPSCFLTKNREILVAGGCLGPNTHTDTMEIFRIPEDSENFKVSEILSKNLEIEASCSAFDPFSTSSFKPIFGGFQAHSCLDDVQIIEITEKSKNVNCRKIASKKLPKIKNATVCEVKNGEFLIFGGWEDETRTTKAIRRIIFNSDFTDFDVVFEGFLPYEVEGHSLVKHDSSIYLIGGFDGFSVINTIIKYDMVTRKSEVIPQKLAEKRENHVSAVLADKFLVVAGGWNGTKSIDDVEIFEIDGLARCQVEGKLNIARNRPAGVAI